MPLVLKPGSAEPWTPLRMINAWVKAGAPAGAFAYYPTDHAGGNEILRSTGRGMVFGDVGSTKRWKADGRVEVHGPGYSKVVIGPDVADQWEQYIDVIAESMSNNGGRSCVNASGVWVTKHADAIADALAKKLSRVMPRAADDAEAVLAPFADPETAQRISAMIDADMTRRSAARRATYRPPVRGTDRVATRTAARICCRPCPLRRDSSAGQSRVPVPVRQRGARCPPPICPTASARRSSSRASRTIRRSARASSRRRTSIA